jgi:signal transduction histidine kinase
VTPEPRSTADLERELRATRAQLHNLIDRNADAVIVVDRHGLVRFANPAAEELFGRSRHEITGSELGLPFVIGETTEIDILARGEEPCVAEMRVVETEWEGEAAVLALLRDITERKRAEVARAELFQEQAARAQAEQALRERDDFMALASHELKTPAATLSATAQLLNRQLQRQGSLDVEQQRRALERLHEQSRRLAHLIEHLLDGSRINAGQMTVTPQPFDLVQVATTVVTSCQSTTTGHTLRLTAPSQLEILGDAIRIEQVLTNLVDNAIKYSPDGGEIDVDIRLAKTDPDCVSLTVRDHGIGIPEDRREHLFERFFRAHTLGNVSGMGLGLFITHHLVEMHGGSIAVDSPDDGGGGARFVVQLPLRASALAS